MGELDRSQVTGEDVTSPPSERVDAGPASLDGDTLPDDMSEADMTPPAPPLPSCSADDFWPVSSPLRRLTNKEFVNTINAAFYGHDNALDRMHTTNRLQPEFASTLWTHDSFVNKATNQQVTALQVERYLDFITWYVKGTQLKPDGSAPATDQGHNYRRSNLPTDEQVLYGSRLKSDGTRDSYGWSPCEPERDAPIADYQSCGDEMVASLLPALYRRPLKPEELTDAQIFLRELIADKEQARSENDSSRDVMRRALDVFLLAVLQSPDLLYRPELGQAQAVSLGQASPLDAYELASRLSFFLWQTVPDEELWDAAASGALLDDATLKAQAERMMRHPRARVAMRDFFKGWLKLDKLDNLSGNLTPWHENRALRTYVYNSPHVTISNEGQSSGYSTWLALNTSLQRATLAYIDWLFWEADSWAELTSGDQTFATALMSDLYDLPAVPPGPLPEGFVDDPNTPQDKVYMDTLSSSPQRVTMPSGQRAGLLTQPGILAMTSHERSHSPIFRGVFLTHAILCRTIDAQPNPEPEDVPDVETCTTRDNVAKLHSFATSCQACHTMIDALGFAFEHYDELGIWRDKENGCDVDASVSVPSTGFFASDVGGDYHDGVELARALRTSRDAKACMVRHWMRYALGEDEVSDTDIKDPERLRRHQCQQAQVQALVDEFDAQGESLQALVVSIVMSPSFRYKARPTSSQGGDQ